MPAPTIAALLDYETAYEDAAAAHLSNTLSGVQVLTARSATQGTGPVLTTPRVTVGCIVTGTDPDQQNDRPASAGQYDSHKLAALSLECVTRRGASGTSLGTLRGSVRAALLAGSSIFNSNALPYYQTIVLREAGSASGTEPDNDEITTVLSYDLQFFIKPSEWPTA
jgi:hypothetical protein